MKERRELSIRQTYALVFLSHFSIIILEVCGMRILGQTFGMSLYTWGAMIGVVMLGIGIGSLLGGFLADKNPHFDLLGPFCIIASAFLFLTLASYHTLLLFLSRLDVITGTIFASIILFLPAITSLSMIPPFVIKRKMLKGQPGYSAGSVWSLATTGDLCGIIITVIILVPAFGSAALLYMSLLIIGVFGIYGISLQKRTYAILAPLLLFPLPLTTPLPTGTIHYDESFYNTIYVQRTSNELLLKLNQQDLVHSRLIPGEYLVNSYSDYFLLGRYYYGRPSRVLFLGVGGGNAMVQWDYYFPTDDMTGVEIDGKVANIAHTYFGVPSSQNSRIHVDDARPWLKNNKQTYDIIIIDVYQGSAYAPFYMMTQEFFADVHNHLSKDGILMINVFDRSSDMKLLKPITATVATSFPGVYYFDYRNKVIFATKERTTLETVKARFLSLPDVDATQNVEHLYEYVRGPDDYIFTDERSDIEVRTYQMMKEFKEQERQAQQRVPA